MNPFFTLYQGLHREGPGKAAVVKRAAKYDLIGARIIARNGWAVFYDGLQNNINAWHPK